MSKFIFFQDAHCQGVNSVNRLGNYFEDWLLKFDEVISLAQQHQCEAIIDGGDLLEIKNPAYTVLDAIADRIEKAQIPIVSLLGNHAMHCGHFENSANTGLRHIQKRSKYFQYFDIIAKKEFYIEGYEYRYGIEDWIREEGLYTNKDESRWKIAVVHALITPSKFFKNANYIIPEEIKTDYDLILCAHYHQPFYKKVRNTEFLNIGCMGRLTINEAKIEPSVLLLDTDKRNYEIIKLKSAKPGNEIFDLEHYEENKQKEKTIDDFLNLLQGTEFITLDLVGQLEKLVKDNKLDAKVKDYMIQKIGEIKNG